MAKKSEQSNGHQLTRTKLAQVLNGSRYAETRRAAGHKGQIISNTAIGRWVTEQGCPVNPDGKTLSIADVAAWLVVRCKDAFSGGGDARKEDLFSLEVEKLKAQIRHYETGSNFREVKTELENIKRRIQDGELLESSEVKQGQVERARYIRETLENLGNYASRFQGKNVAEIRAELNGVGSELCHALAGDADDE